MTRILFICHGNICRSPMAEFVMRDLIEKAGVQDRFEVASAATSCEELGNPVYPPARRVLEEHGLSCRGKTARRIAAGDYEKYDWLIAMDESNVRDMRRFFPRDPDGKIHLLMDLSDRPRSVADPWYTGDFSTAWRDVQEGCCQWLKWLLDGEKA